VTYRVRTTQRAEADAEAMYLWIAEHEAQPLNALRWLDGLQDAIASLREYPLRCPRAPETAHFDAEVRQLLFHSHRVLIVVEGEDVIVLHIRHASRLPATDGDLAGAED
jgi:plasmid stabilization system protein ParE